jgi:hypothetical protein
MRSERSGTTLPQIATKCQTFWQQNFQCPDNYLADAYLEYVKGFGLGADPMRRPK